MDYITDLSLPFNTDALNQYLYSHYKTYSSRKRAGNEVLRFAKQTLGMSDMCITFVRPIKPVGGEKKVVMSAEDNEKMLQIVSKEVNFRLVDDNNDRYRAALLIILCNGCRPIEACKAKGSHFSYDKL